MTKRQAIAAIFMGCLAKMAHADDPNQKTPANGLSPWNGPTTWTVNLNTMKDLRVMLDDREIIIPAAEIFAALKS